MSGSIKPKHKCLKWPSKHKCKEWRRRIADAKQSGSFSLQDKEMVRNLNFNPVYQTVGVKVDSPQEHLPHIDSVLVKLAQEFYDVVKSDDVMTAESLLVAIERRWRWKVCQPPDWDKIKLNIDAKWLLDSLASKDDQDNWKEVPDYIKAQVKRCTETAIKILIREENHGAMLRL